MSLDDVVFVFERTVQTPNFPDTEDLKPGEKPYHNQFYIVESQLRIPKKGDFDFFLTLGELHNYLKTLGNLQFISGTPEWIPEEVRMPDYWEDNHPLNFQNLATLRRQGIKIADTE